MATPKEPGNSEASANPGGTEALSFEEAFNRLGETVQSLETGGLSLDAATNLYEEGMRLVQLCNRYLSTAELKITQLKDTYSEYPSERPPEDEE